MSQFLTPREQWLALLAKLSAPSNPGAAAEALRAMLPLIADFPDGAFTLASLEHVARATRRTPSYGELREHLGQWWKDNRPQQATRAIAHDSLPHQVEALRRAELAREWDDPVGIRLRWASIEDTHPMRERCRKLLGAAVARHATQHIGLIPPDYWPEWYVEQMQEAAE